MILDYREADLISLIPNTSVQSLIVGDIWIGNIIIERKTVRDFEASFLDGRYREQRGRILAYCQEHKSQPLYLIEGDMVTTGRLTNSAVMKLLNRLSLRYNIPFIRTTNVQESAEWLKILETQWNEDPTALQRTTELIQVADNIHIQKKKNTTNTFTIACLAQCPGISVKMSEAIHQTFGSLSNLLNVSSEEIQEIRYGNRKIGPVVSKRLYDLLHGIESK